MRVRACLVMLVLVLAACGGSATPSDEATSPTAGDATEATEVEVLPLEDVLDSSIVVTPDASGTSATLSLIHI